MRATATALFSGTLFGAGLAVSQMTNPAKVLAFLDVAGAWDPTLAFVMGAALVVYALAYRFAGGPRPALPATGVDARLLAGAALFGVGWGLAGFCPGPALAALVTASGEVALFVAAMLAGMGAFAWMERRGAARPSERPESPRGIPSQGRFGANR